MIYITASNGVYYYDEANDVSGVIMDNKYRRKFFAKKAYGYFGICHHKGSNSIIVSSREKLGTPKSGKPTTDAGLHAIDISNNTFRTIGYIKDIHDVHQIDVYQDLVLLTDTGKNRVIVYDILKCEVTKIINVGKERDDINHINAVTVLNENIYIGLNNRGHKDSEIMVVPVSILDSPGSTFQADNNCSIITLKNHKYTHDIEPYRDSFLVSISHDSFVISADTLKPVMHGDNWVRGLAVSESGIWAGQSHFAKRSKRHGKKFDGLIIHVNPKDNTIMKSVKVNAAGQINDLLVI